MKTFISVILISLVLTSCMKDNELKKSVYINDPENFELPAYSEWGYNTFGAYYDRELFVYSDELVPAKIIVSDTASTFLLDGHKGPSGYYYDGYPEMMVSFRFSGFTPEDYADLALLNDSVIDLENPACHVSVTIDTTIYPAEILEGELNFKRVQILKVDNQLVEAILSGYFDFKAIINNKPVTISDGRFDVGIGPDNFYRNN
ncbi:MAG TPA: hypothetical protein VK179_14105 [Bacteroidales bacterium]|nr:hypothetical protein [Bacteroidales bacterium]